VSGAANTDSLVHLREQLLAAPANTEWQAQDAQLSAESIERFIDVASAMDLAGMNATPGSNEAPTLALSGVDVSVRPDLVLRGTHRGAPIVGAVKFHFSKTHGLTEDAGLNVASVLHQYVDAHLLRPGETASVKHCLVLDVFSKTWSQAPKSFRMRRASIRAACQEIALWWAAA
jgi:hypothetical protein